MGGETNKLGIVKIHQFGWHAPEQSGREQPPADPKAGAKATAVQITGLS
jgi:hypothetical protein